MQNRSQKTYNNFRKKLSILTRKKLIFHKKSFSILLSLLFAIELHGARPMHTDDASVVDARSCQLESWGRFGADANEFWLLPGCNLIFDSEISLGIKPTNPQGMLFGIKKIKNDLEEDGYSFGIALGNVYNIKRGGNKNDIYGYIPLSFSILEGRLLVHTNVGYNLEEYKRGIYTYGVGIEVEVNDSFWILAESFVQRCSRTMYQLGARFWVVKDRFQVDITYGNSFVAKNGWVSAGIRLLSNPLY